MILKQNKERDGERDEVKIKNEKKQRYRDR